MRSRILCFLSCPAHPDTPLTLAGVSAAEIHLGELTCASCQRIFHIVDGIPRLTLTHCLNADETRQIMAIDQEYAQQKKIRFMSLPERDVIRAAAGRCTGEWVLDLG